MTAASMKVEAAKAEEAKLKAGSRKVQARAAEIKDQIRLKVQSITDYARAEGLGETCGTAVASASEIAALEASLAGYQEAELYFQRQIPSAVANVVSAEREHRQEQSLYVRQHILPELQEAAKLHGVQFGRAMAALAAAEDASLRLQRRPEDGYATGDAGSLLIAMSKTTGRQVFCDAGAGRGPWDWDGYGDSARRIEDALRETEA